MKRDTGGSYDMEFGLSEKRDGVIPTFAIWASIAIATIVAMMTITVLQLNAERRETEQRLVLGSFDAELERLASVSLEYAFWDDTIENTLTSPDAVWIERELGQYVFTDQNVDATIVINGEDVGVVGYLSGEAVDLLDAMTRSESLAVLVAKARESLTILPVRPMTGFVMLDGRLYVAAASPLTPEDAVEGERADPNRAILVFMRAVEEPLLDIIARRSLLEEMSVSQSPTAPMEGAALVLTDATGQGLGTISWTAQRPGSDLLAQLVLPIVGLLILLALVAWSFVRRAQGMARSLVAGQAELERQNDLLRHRESEALKARDAAERAIAEEERAIEALKARTLDLEVARQEAIGSSQAKSMFLASMSHELRTPLNSIIGFSEIIRDQRFGPVGQDRYVEYAADIWNSGTHLLELINDVLDVSRLESGKQRLRLERLDLERLVEQAVNLFRESALTASIRISMDLRVRTIIADRQGVLRILINLLSNAVKFTNEGGSVFVRTENAEFNGRPTVSIVVSDTGIGIPVRELSRVVRPFERVETRYTAGRPGTGLGLALVKSLAELHSGTFDIQSKVGVGTTVTVTLPHTANSANSIEDAPA